MAMPRGMVPAGRPVRSVPPEVSAPVAVLIVHMRRAPVVPLRVMTRVTPATWSQAMPSAWVWPAAKPVIAEELIKAPVVVLMRRSWVAVKSSA